MPNLALKPAYLQTWCVHVLHLCVDFPKSHSLGCLDIHLLAKPLRLQFISKKHKMVNFGKNLTNFGIFDKKIQSWLKYQHLLTLICSRYCSTFSLLIYSRLFLTKSLLYPSLDFNMICTSSIVISTGPLVNLLQGTSIVSIRMYPWTTVIGKPRDVLVMSSKAVALSFTFSFSILRPQLSITKSLAVKSYNEKSATFWLNFEKNKRGFLTKWHTKIRYFSVFLTNIWTNIVIFYKMMNLLQ